MTDRCRCIVIGCNRTTGKFDPSVSEWLCGVHWPMVSRRIKALRSKVRRELRRGRNTVLDRIDRYLWREAKRQATERAMGIRA